MLFKKLFKKNHQNPICDIKHIDLPSLCWKISSPSNDPIFKRNSVTELNRKIAENIIKKLTPKWNGYIYTNEYLKQGNYPYKLYPLLYFNHSLLNEGVYVLEGCDKLFLEYDKCESKKSEMGKRRKKRIFNAFNSSNKKISITIKQFDDDWFFCEWENEDINCDGGEFFKLYKCDGEDGLIQFLEYLGVIK